MKDRLENFVRENRESFDHKTPPADLWSKVEAGLPAKRRRLFPWKGLSIAASVVLLLGLVGTWSYNQGMQQGSINSLAEISNELGEVEKHYQTEIKNKLAQLASYNKEDEVEGDIKEMDVFLNELKSDLKHTPKSEREVVIQAMIANYRSRVELLERVLDRLQQNSTNKLSKDETKSI